MNPLKSLQELAYDKFIGTIRRTDLLEEKITKDTKETIYQQIEEKLTFCCMYQIFQDFPRYRREIKSIGEIKEEDEMYKSTEKHIKDIAIGIIETISLQYFILKKR